MTSEQEQLVFQILVRLGDQAMSYEEVEYGYVGHCKHCDGEEEGWPDAHDFEHEPNCIVLLIGKLGDTLN